MQSALPEAPAHKITVKGQDAMPTGQTRGAEAASQPEWLVHIEAEPRVRSGEVLQRVAEVNKPPSPLLESAPPTILWPTQHYIPNSADQETAEATFQSSWSVLIAIKLTRKETASGNLWLRESSTGNT